MAAPYVARIVFSPAREAAKREQEEQRREAEGGESASGAPERLT